MINPTARYIHLTGAISRVRRPFHHDNHESSSRGCSRGYARARDDVGEPRCKPVPGAPALFTEPTGAVCRGATALEFISMGPGFVPPGLCPPPIPSRSLTPSAFSRRRLSKQPEALIKDNSCNGVIGDDRGLLQAELLISIWKSLLSSARVRFALLALLSRASVSVTLEHAVKLDARGV